MTTHHDIDDLIIAFLNGKAVDEEALQRWRSASATNEARFAEMKRIWAITAAAAPATMAGAAPDPDTLIGRAGDGGRRLSAAPAGIGRTRGGPLWRSHLLKAAAIAAIMIPVGYGLAMLRGVSSPAPAVIDHGELRTASGERATLILPDQSTILLGPRSRIRVTEGSEGVVARLEGRAFFGVESGASRTWTVRTRGGDAVVLGTRFEVRSEDEEFRVLVVQGRVQVRAGESAAQLSMDEMSIARAGAPLAVRRVSNAHDHLGWLGDSLVFQATPLEAAVREIEDRYGVAFDPVPPELASLTVTVTFTGQPVDEVVGVLCEIVRARCPIEADRIRIESRTPRP